MLSNTDVSLTENGKKTKQAIFDTAVKILKEEGYDKLTVRKICKESNTSNGSFYHFFKNKEELMAYYYTKSADDFLADQDQNEVGDNLYDKLLNCYQWYIKYTTSFGLDFCINFFNSKNRAIDPNHMYNAFYEISKDYLREYEDQIRPGYTIDQIAKDLCVIAKGIIFDWSSALGNYDINEMATRMFSIYLDSVVVH